MIFLPAVCLYFVFAFILTILNPLLKFGNVFFITYFLPTNDESPY